MDDAREPVRTLLPQDHDTKSLYFLLNSLVVPRPIAWVSSLTADGTTNLAPHSYFTVAASAPPMVSFTSIGDKDTLRNVRATGEFVVNLVDHTLIDHMNVSSAAAPPDVSEFELAGVTPDASRFVAPPRVVEAPVALECRVVQIVEVGNGRMVVGEVLAFHVAERLWNEKDRVDPGLLDAVARMGGSTYATTRDRFDLRRPTYDELVGTE
ncbi:MAG: Nitrilotriacetate monooxygenase component [Thermoleophilia bacterium]|nr:Nitrilotriacetate monooxygenase component [Thermoleophilia bacterium]